MRGASSSTADTEHRVNRYDCRCKFFTKVSLSSHGIVPNTKPAGAAGGECTEFNGQLIGLVVPALEQVRIVVDTIFGEREQVSASRSRASRCIAQTNPAIAGLASTS